VSAFPESELDPTQAVAIIAMSCRLPGAADPETFWHNLCAGREELRPLSDAELLAAGVEPAALADPDYVRVGSTLPDIERFDADFFGYTPREAEAIDPQQRVFLECAWEALERAGIDSERADALIGVYAGSGTNTYLLRNLLSDRAAIEALGEYHASLGNEKDFLATRTAYKLNLRGPAVTVQTACSTSLVAVHMAYQSLLAGECDLALAGGVTVSVPQGAGYRFQEGGIYSPDGHCRAFDAQGRGTVSGSGAGVVLLRRLSDALAQGDTIHAVIRASAINNDGALKVGFTAPSQDGQAAVVAQALAMADIPAESIRYIEAHGTATALGDPIEVAALTQAFRENTDAAQFCAIGSVKTNLGHLDTAAGVAGLIKTVLALRHGQIPPSLHYERPNPQIDFEHSPFFVNTRLRDWPADPFPRRAGVSSFGIGGTNAHIILEQAPPQPAAPAPEPAHELLTLSARSPQALEQAARALAAHLRAHPEQPLADVAYTLHVGRRAFEHRRALVARDRAEALGALEGAEDAPVFQDVRPAHERPLAFLFPGQGAQHPGMAAELYETEPLFRAEVDRCAELLRPHLGLDIRSLLFERPDQGPTTKDQHSQLEDADVGRSSFVVGRLDQTQYAQPALFVIEYALARLWMAWGVRPQALIGHSLGEYVAATLAGVFSLEDALRLVAARGRLMQSLPPGAMLSVALGPDDLAPLLGADLALAALNAPQQSVVAGPSAAVEALEQHLAARGVKASRLRTSHAFHSPLVEPVLAPFARLVAEVRLSPPRIPLISNVTGTWLSAAEATDPHYWAGHIRQTVRFADGVRELLREPGRVLLEVGPRRTLSALAQQSAGADRPLALCSLHAGDGGSERAALLTALGRLWLAGAPVDWDAVHAGQPRRRVELPTYPFERQRFWIDPRPAGAEAADTALRLYLPAWRRADLPAAPAAPGVWLVLADEHGLAAALERRLTAEDHTVVQVQPGPSFSRLDERRYTVNPVQPEDYARLLEDLRVRGRLPQAALHLWGLGQATPAGPDPEHSQRDQALGFLSAYLLGHAWAAGAGQAPLRLLLVASQTQALTAGEPLSPERAALAGVVLALALALPQIAPSGLDVRAPQSPADRERLAAQVLAEAAAPASPAPAAYRGGQRWVRDHDALQSDGAPSGPPERGAYLLAYGLDGPALPFARALAHQTRARLALLEDAAFPPRAAWEPWLAAHAEADPTSRRIRSALALEQLGAELSVFPADPADETQLRRALQGAQEQLGALDGLLHSVGGLPEPPAQGRQNEGARLRERFDREARLLRGLAAALEGSEVGFALSLAELPASLGEQASGLAVVLNPFVDAFAQQHSSRAATPWAVLHSDQPERQEQADQAAWNQLALALARRRAGPLLASGAHPARRARLGGAAQARPEQTAAPADVATAHPRPNLQNRYVAPRNQIERNIAEVWQRIFGFEQIGVHDNFFDLGGSSFLAVQVTAETGKALGRELTVAALYDGLTVAALAQLVQDQSEEPGDEQRAEQSQRLSQRQQHLQRRRHSRDLAEEDDSF